MLLIGHCTLLYSHFSITIYIGRNNIPKRDEIGERKRDEEEEEERER